MPLSTSLSMTSPLQDAMATACSIFDFAEQIKVSGLLVFHQLFFMVNFPLKLECENFVDHYIHLEPMVKLRPPPMFTRFSLYMNG